MSQRSTLPHLNGHASTNGVAQTTGVARAARPPVASTPDPTPTNPHSPAPSPSSHPTSNIPHQTSLPHTYFRITEHTPDDQYQQFLARKQTPLIPILHFNPPEEIVSLIIHDLASADLNLRDVATAAHTSIDSLTLWMSRPDIAARLDAVESAMARKNRLTVANRTTAILNTCTQILDQYTDAENNCLYNPRSIRDLSLLLKNRQSALQACKIIQRIHSYSTPRPPRERVARAARGGLPVMSTPNPTSPAPHAPTPHPTPHPTAPRAPSPLSNLGD